MKETLLDAVDLLTVAFGSYFNGAKLQLIVFAFMMGRKNSSYKKLT